MASRGPIPSGGNVDPERGRTPIDTGPRDEGGMFDPGNRGPIDGDPADDPTTTIRPRTQKREPRARTVTVGATAKWLPVIYGRTQCGALVPYAIGVGNILYIQYFIGEGPIDAIEQLSFGESPTTTFAALGLREGVDYNLYLGTHDQSPDPLLASTQDAGVWIWKFPRIAYVTLKLNLSLPAYDNVDPMSFRCVPKGLLVNDHRIDGTMLYANRAYSNNSSLCTVDFLRNPLFGAGADDSELEFNSWDEAADDCDVVIATGLGAPPAAPTFVQLGSPLGIENGVYEYGYTVTDATGVESQISPESGEMTVSNTSGRSTRVNDLNNVGGTVKKTIYRRKKNISTGVWGPFKRVPGAVIPDTRTYGVDSFSTGQLGGSPPDGSSVLQFRTNCHIRGEGETIGDTIDMLRGTMTAHVVYNDGKWQGYVDKARAQTGIIYDSSDIIGIPTITGADPADSPTQVVVHFVNAALNFKPDEAPYPRQEVLTGTDRLDRIIHDETYESIDSYDQAYRVAKWLYNRSVLAGFTIAWRTGQKGALPLPMARIQVAHARMGLPATNVILSSAGPDSRDTWMLRGELEITPDTDYHADPGTDPPVVDPPPPPPQPPTPADSSFLRIGWALDDEVEWTPGATSVPVSYGVGYGLQYNVFGGTNAWSDRLAAPTSPIGLPFNVYGDLNNFADSNVGDTALTALSLTRHFIEFDTSSIPGGATVTGVALRLQVTKSADCRDDTGLSARVVVAESTWDGTPSTANWTLFGTSLGDMVIDDIITAGGGPSATSPFSVDIPLTGDLGMPAATTIRLAILLSDDFDSTLFPYDGDNVDVGVKINNLSNAYELIVEYTP